MKIRISGTKWEIEQAQKYYKELEKSKDIVSVEISRPYANRGSNTIFRLYVDIQYLMTQRCYIDEVAQPLRNERK